MIEERKYLNYEDRLIQTGLTTLNERRTRVDLIEMFTMIEGLNKAEYRCFFTVSQNSKTK